jgi:hypothetical protein
MANTYNVSVFRELRLAFGGIEADSPEAAAAIARDKPTDQADSIDDECDGENLAALVDVAGDEEHRQTRAIDFEPERQRKAAPRLRSALEFALEFLTANDDGEDDVRSRIAAAEAALADADAAGIAPAAPPATKTYSVLLLYPNHANDGGKETYYAWVEAPDPIAAIAEARRQALAANEWTEDDVDPAGFVPLLVTEGHHHGQPTSND